MTHTERTHLDTLIAASNSAWEAARNGLGLEDKEWQHAADAEHDFRKEVGEDYATKFENCYRYGE